jgi:restriction system protein
MATKKDLPSYDKYFPFVVEAMKDRGGSATIEEMEEDVAALMKLPENLLVIPHKNSSRSQFAYELAWVRTLSKKGWHRGKQRQGGVGLNRAGGKGHARRIAVDTQENSLGKKGKGSSP